MKNNNNNKVSKKEVEIIATKITVAMKEKYI